jgi:hypothetical protein
MVFWKVCTAVLSLYHLVIGEDLCSPNLLSNPFEFINKIFEMK